MGERDPESGITLVEVLVSSMLTLVVLTMAYSILSTTSKTATTVSNEATNTADARLVVDALEANLRFATAVSLCGPGSTTTTCVPPTLPPATPPSATLAVANPTGSSQAPCTYWTFSTVGLLRTGTMLMTGVSATIPPNALVGAAAPGFSLPAPVGRLVQVDLKVNNDRAYKASDTVDIHDLIAPANVATNAAISITGQAC